ncbi:hypothetical protein PJI17_25030 [Mycobacterium kansasii]
MFNRRVAAICGIALVAIPRVVGPVLLASGQTAQSPVVLPPMPSARSIGAAGQPGAPRHHPPRGLENRPRRQRRNAIRSRHLLGTG